LRPRDVQPQKVSTVHLLLAILKDETCLVTADPGGHEHKLPGVKQQLQSDLPSAKSDYHDEEDESEGPADPGKGQARTAKPTSDTPVLDNFGIDITRAAEEGRLDPIVGRENEIQRIAQILSRRKKNNPVLDW
jgi:ATP-dependent Clp protease ATP-binding subunit ClpC